MSRGLHPPVLRKVVVDRRGDDSCSENWLLLLVNGCLAPHKPTADTIEGIQSHHCAQFICLRTKSSQVGTSNPCGFQIIVTSDCNRYCSSSDRSQSFRCGSRSLHLRNYRHTKRDSDRTLLDLLKSVSLSEACRNKPSNSIFSILVIRIRCRLWRHHYDAYQWWLRLHSIRRRSPN